MPIALEPLLVEKLNSFFVVAAYGEPECAVEIANTDGGPVTEAFCFGSWISYLANALISPFFIRC